MLRDIKDEIQLFHIIDMEWDHMVCQSELHLILNLKGFAIPSNL